MTLSFRRFPFPGGIGPRSIESPPHTRRNFDEDEEGTFPPEFPGPTAVRGGLQPRIHDDLGPGIAGGYDRGTAFAPRSPDLLMGGNLVGPNQIEQQFGRGGFSGPAAGPGGSRIGPHGHPQPRHDPVGPFPGMERPNADHMRRPGPRGFGPGGML